MNYRMVGRTGMEVSILGFGAAPMAGLFRDIPESQAVETVQAALRAGVTYFDTAPKYGNGLSERRLGMALADVPRESYTLSTKVGWDVSSVEGMPSDFTRAGKQPDFTKEGTKRGFEASLERLQLDHVDIVHIHDPDRHYEDAISNVYPVLDDLRNQGVIKAVSVGINQWQLLDRFMADGDFDCFMLANQYSLLLQDGLGLMDRCVERRIGILSAGVFATGILATGAIPGAKYRYRDAPPEIMEKTRLLEEVCQRYNVPLSTAALQFPLGHPAVSSIVIGCSSPDRVSKNMAALETPIPHALWEDLQKSGLIESGCPLPTRVVRQ